MIISGAYTLLLYDTSDKKSIVKYQRPDCHLTVIFSKKTGSRAVIFDSLALILSSFELVLCSFDEIFKNLLKSCVNCGRIMS